MRRAAASALVLMNTLVPLSAAEAEGTIADELWRALTSGDLSHDVRYRHEHVEQDGVPRDANAHTLRVRSGYRTGLFKSFGLEVEVEALAPLGDDTYNDTVNGKSRYPVIADPRDVDVNQARLFYRGPARTTASVGRERIVIDDQRFIGDVGFRQNQQTFDAVSVTSEAIPNLRARYHYIFGVNRIFGRDNEAGNTTADTHAVNVGYRGLGPMTLGGYAYVVDLDDRPAAATMTFGARLTGSRLIGDDASFLYQLEWARQVDHADNPDDVSLDYVVIKPSLFIGDLALTLAYERLEGDGRNGFQTPLGTLHKFQGWADVFLGTPPDGIESYSLSVGYVLDDVPGLEPINLQAFVFDFNAQRGGLNYGREFDFEAAMPLPWEPRVRSALRFAHYDARGFGADVEKIWFTLAARF